MTISPFVSKLMLMLRQGCRWSWKIMPSSCRCTNVYDGLNIATVPETSMVREFGFVLAVKANVPGEHLQTHFLPK